MKGRKIVYWRERAFLKRLLPPPVVPPYPAPSPPPSDAAPSLATDSLAADPLRLELGDLRVGEVALEPPPENATEAEVEAWVDRFIDAAVLPPEPRHDR